MVNLSYVRIYVVRCGIGRRVVVLVPDHSIRSGAVVHYEGYLLRNFVDYYLARLVIFRIFSRAAYYYSGISVVLAEVDD